MGRATSLVIGVTLLLLSRMCLSVWKIYFELSQNKDLEVCDGEMDGENQTTFSMSKELHMMMVFHRNLNLDWLGYARCLL